MRIPPVRTLIDELISFIIMWFRTPNNYSTRRGPLSGETQFFSSTCFITAVYAHSWATVKGLSPHCLRHGLATHALQGGAFVRDLQVVLRHSHLDRTMLYLHELSLLPLSSSRDPAGLRSAAPSGRGTAIAETACQLRPTGGCSSLPRLARGSAPLAAQG